jgi:HAD superfamily hydrolase (TIGR01459 family)
VIIAVGERFSDLACTGLSENRLNPSDYLPDLEQWAKRDVNLHCLNPDRLVIRGGVPEACAGAIADLYDGLGGHVTWYGKPHEAIYRHALQRAGNPQPREVLAIGDGLQTDVLGAAKMGFDVIFVSGGIHSGESFPQDFAARNGLGDWQPLAVVDSLA